MSKVDSVEDKSIHEMTKSDCLTEIGRILGYNTIDRNQISKRMANSIVWYITGTEAFYRGRFGTERSPEGKWLREKVADAVGFPFPGEWAQTNESPFRRNQLRAVVVTLRNSDDQRWDE